MTTEQRKYLELAYEKIEAEEWDYICEKSDEWQDCEEAKMIDPNETFWWGLVTMGVQLSFPEARGARLTGIAMMLTMPKEIIQHKCCKTKTK